MTHSTLSRIFTKHIKFIQLNIAKKNIGLSSNNAYVIFIRIFVIKKESIVAKLSVDI